MDSGPGAVVIAAWLPVTLIAPPEIMPVIQVNPT